MSSPSSYLLKPGKRKRSERRTDRQTDRQTVRQTDRQDKTRKEKKRKEKKEKKIIRDNNVHQSNKILILISGTT